MIDRMNKWFILNACREGNQSNSMVIFGLEIIFEDWKLKLNIFLVRCMDVTFQKFDDFDNYLNETLCLIIFLRKKD